MFWWFQFSIKPFFFFTLYLLKYVCYAFHIKFCSSVSLLAFFSEKENEKPSPGILQSIYLQFKFIQILNDSERHPNAPIDSVWFLSHVVRSWAALITVICKSSKHCEKHFRACCFFLRCRHRQLIISSNAWMKNHAFESTREKKYSVEKSIFILNRYRSMPCLQSVNWKKENKSLKDRAWCNGTNTHRKHYESVSLSYVRAHKRLTFVGIVNAPPSQSCPGPTNSHFMDCTHSLTL